MNLINKNLARDKEDLMTVREVDREREDQMRRKIWR